VQRTPLQQRHDRRLVMALDPTAEGAAASQLPAAQAATSNQKELIGTRNKVARLAAKL
jgi:hypothetical protein